MENIKWRKICKPAMKSLFQTTYFLLVNHIRKFKEINFLLSVYLVSSGNIGSPCSII